MAAAFVLALREGTEAVLILTFVLGLLKKSGRLELRRHAWTGTAVAALVALAAALVLTWLGTEFEGSGEIIFEGTSMFLAGSFLIWMVFWVRRQSVPVTSSLAAKIGRLPEGNVAVSIFAVTFFAVLREGLEFALFMVALGSAAQNGSLLAGALAGMVFAALLGFLLYTSVLKINMRQFFRITNILLMFFAAGLLAGSAREFADLGLIPVIIPKIYDISSILNTTNFAGGMLRSLFGYNPAPSLIEILVYLFTLGFILLSMRKPMRQVRVES